MDQSLPEVQQQQPIKKTFKPPPGAFNFATGIRVQATKKPVISDNENLNDSSSNLLGNEVTSNSENNPFAVTNNTTNNPNDTNISVNTSQPSQQTEILRKPPTKPPPVPPKKVSKPSSEVISEQIVQQNKPSLPPKTPKKTQDPVDSQNKLITTKQAQPPNRPVTPPTQKVPPSVPPTTSRPPLSTSEKTKDLPTKNSKPPSSSSQVRSTKQSESENLTKESNPSTRPQIPVARIPSQVINETNIQEINQLKGTINQLQQKEKELIGTINQQTSNINDLNNSLKQKDFELNKIKMENESLKNQLNEIKKKMNDIIKKHEEKEKVINTVVKTKTEQENMIEQLKNKIQNLKKENDRLSKENERLSKENKQFQEKIESLSISTVKDQQQKENIKLSETNNTSVKEERMEQPVQYIDRVQVIYDYKAEEDIELTLKVGDIIDVISKNEGGWWKGNINGKMGMFPGNFVAPITETPSVKAGREEYVKARVIFDWDAQEDDELTLRVGDIIDVLKMEESGWWKGKLRGNIGLFPDNFVEIIDDNKILCKVKAISSYTAQDEDELTFEEGDIIEVLQQDASGWWKGRITSNGKQINGLFPSNFTEVITNT